MYCGKCGAKLPEGAKFCGKCGTPVKRGKHGSYDPHGGVHTPKWVKVVLVSLLLVVGTGVFLGALLGGDERIDNPIPPQANSIDECYTPNVENIVFEDDSKTFGYVNNMVLLFAYSYTPQERLFEIADEIGGEIIGQIPEVYQYQIQVSPRSREELESLCDRLMDYEEVKFSTIDVSMAIQNDGLWTPNDPWKDKIEGRISGVNWDEGKPDGYNWWLEATRVVSAWQHRNNFSDINVGVIDSGFDTTHKDLNITLLNSDKNIPDDHGTHVAGIIGATVDNNIGVSGVMPEARLYGYDSYMGEKITHSTSILDAIVACRNNSCKVINISQCAKFSNTEETRKNIKEWARYFLAQLILYIDEDKSESDIEGEANNDFIIVQSAGNGDHDDSLFSNGVDARQYGGYFASITEDMINEVLNIYKDELAHKLTAQDITNTIIVVGAVDKEKRNNAWQLAKWSNYGSAVDICAPGVDVYSTVISGGWDGDYANYEPGTSFAAPIVSGITAMVWSIDPEMSAAEVKQIITSTADIPVLSRQKADHGTYHMVNAGAAVEEALKRKASKDNRTSGSDLVLGTPNPGSNPTATPAPTPEPSTFVLETLPPTRPSGGNIPDEALRALEQAGGDMGPLGDGEHIVQLDKSLLFESADGTYAVVTIMETNTYTDEYVHSLKPGDEIYVNFDEDEPYLPVTDIEFRDAFDGSGQVFSFGNEEYYLGQVNGVWHMFWYEYMCTGPAGSTLILIPPECNFYDGMDYRDQSENDGPGYYGNYYPEHRVGSILDVFTDTNVFDEPETSCHVIVKLRNGAATDVYRFYEP